MAFKLKEMDGRLGEAIGQFTQTKKAVLLDYEDEDHQLWCEPDFLMVLELNIFIFSALYYTYQEELGCYALDHDLILIFSPDGELLHGEHGSSLKVCIQNYCTLCEENILDGDNLNCLWIFDNGNFLESKVLNTKKEAKTTARERKEDFS